MRVTEGKFFGGHLEGYGRINSIEDTKGTMTSIGFYSKGDLHGKAEVYDAEKLISSGIWTAGRLTKSGSVKSYLT